MPPAVTPPGTRNDGPSPTPNSSQKISGWPIAPKTRLGCRTKRIHSRLPSVQAASSGRGVWGVEGEWLVASGWWLVEEDDISLGAEPDDAPDSAMRDSF